MADQFNNDIMAILLSLASGLILLDKMAVHLNELRGMINNERNNNAEFRNFVNHDWTRVETVAWLDHIADNLDVYDAWSFHTNIPFMVQRNLHDYPCLREIHDFIEFNIYQ